ncbi:homoserine kinase [Blastococcus sp. TF02A-26]|uniref:homoserine kinase n=1 Tax=Blastococcus sp. TF02A-26 TaxID=2250577 RepID=UPI000DEB1393|nr:homoserine kinase [Blastococcus sp. TF02A-26]RBY83980.1 homoserine kinase [Blastococcus sp. TF02A-26]
MSEAARTTVRIRVPATSANLGPAFDCAGLALSCADELEFTVTDSGLAVEMTGEGADVLPADESHLVVRAFRAACDQLGWRPAGLRLRTVNAVPQGRGMGSSAAAVVGGVFGAWALCPDVGAIDLGAVLRLATEFEGHADNVAACLHGGVTLAWDGADGPVAERLDVDPRIQPLLLVPDATLSTTAARGLLPGTVPHADAAFNAGRAALLVAALTWDPDLLLPATEDRLHQRQRATAMPESLALVDRLRAEGLAAVVSGAGPSVLVLTVRDPGDDLVDFSDGVAVRRVAALTPPDWRLLPLSVDVTGVRVLSGAQVTS